jgi:hypothetical protein
MSRETVAMVSTTGQVIVVATPYIQFKTTCTAVFQQPDTELIYALGLTILHITYLIETNAADIGVAHQKGV